jgi:hypothetical protein
MTTRAVPARAAILARVVAVAVVKRAPDGSGQRIASNASLRSRMKRASTMARVSSRGVPWREDVSPLGRMTMGRQVEGRPAARTAVG